MTGAGQETEAKFYVRDLNRIKERLEELGGHVIQERVRETNLRFDLPDASLRAGGRVLRLRRDNEAKLTYKGAAHNLPGILSREEIEFTVGDFDKAREFLEALGYRRVFLYEKYRTVYELDQLHIMLDELPYGTFIEIEGEKGEAIQNLAERLALDWQAAIERSYSVLFEQVQERMNLPFHDLSFENFSGVQVNPSDLHVRPADE